MPPAVILPEPSVNEVGKVRPGQYAGRLGNHWDAWHIDIASKCPLGNGACPDCFRFEGTPFEHAASTIFDAPTLTLPQGGNLRLQGRVDLLDFIQGQQHQLEQSAGELDSHRKQAISVLTDPKVRRAFDVERADAKTLERYGKNKFGLSVLMGKRLHRGRREPGPGEPWKEFLLGHPPTKFRESQGKPAATPGSMYLGPAG